MSVKIEIATLRSKLSTQGIEDVVWQLLEEGKLKANSIIQLPSVLQELKPFELQIHSVTTNNLPGKLEREDIQFIYYEFSNQGPEDEMLLESHDSEQVSASSHWLLPNKEHFGLWESLVFDDQLKENLLDFSASMLHFSKLKVDQNIVSCNRLILLHGEPGKKLLFCE